MASFKLTVVTPDRVFYDGEASFLLVRTTEGDIGVLAHHTKLTTPLVIGTMKVEFERSEPRYAAIGGGFLKVGDNKATIVTNACEWQDEIDVSRAERAAEAARAKKAASSSKQEMKLAEIKLQMAMNRLNVANRK